MGDGCGRVNAGRRYGAIVTLIEGLEAIRRRPAMYIGAEEAGRSKCQNGSSNALHHQDSETALLRGGFYINQCRRGSYRAYQDV